METHSITIHGNTTTIETPDGFGAMLVAAMCDAKGYTELVDDGEGNETPNPVDETTFTALQLVSYAREITAAFNVKQQRKTAEATAHAQNDAFAQRISVVR